MQLESVDLSGVGRANVFCSSPFFLRHALAIISRLKDHDVAVTAWSEKGGAVGPALEALALPGVRLCDWPQLPFVPRVSRPWTLLQTRRFLDRFFKSHFQEDAGTVSFYEGDYPEPCMHAMVARCSRRHRVYRFAYAGHDILPVPRVPAAIRFRESLLAHAHGYPIAFFGRPGLPDSRHLPFLKSSGLGIERVDVDLSEMDFSPVRVPVVTDRSRPLVLLLESREEEDTCHDYARDMNLFLDKLESQGWKVIAKGHPRLGSSRAVADRGVALLDCRIPLELFDLSGIEAVAGLCSSGMFSTAHAGIPTFCMENLFHRRDPERRASSIAFLTTDPSWPPEPPRIDILKDWGEVNRITPARR